MNQAENPHPSTGDMKSDQRAAKRILRVIRACLPGDTLKTWVYLNAVLAPRKLLRRAATSFSRFDFVYDTLREFSAQYQGPFSILEFGTAQGYAFAKLLGATRYLKLEDRVTVHGFDSFEGLPDATAEDQGALSNPWMKGAYRASYETLRDYCEKHKFCNYRLYKGYFENSMTPEVLATFQAWQPVIVWVDCDLYSSSLTVMQRLMPYIRSGCVVYFDDYDFNFGARSTGQARLVHEINHGKLGPDIELVHDADLSWDSRNVYRLLRFAPDAPVYKRLRPRKTAPQARDIVDGSPFP